MKALLIIPARGGSKGIPRKNIRFMAGKPLIFYAIDCAKKSKYKPDIYVSTDDSEIANFCKIYRDIESIPRPVNLADDKTTLDPVINHAVHYVEDTTGIDYDIVITMQPTSPLLSTETLDNGIESFFKNGFDTILSGVNAPRLSWRYEAGKYIKNYKERLNRQYMPKDIAETGAFVITKREFVKENSRFGENISVFEVPENESVDIDTPDDWHLCELKLNRKKIIIRLDGYKEIGMGHVYRGLLLAQALMEHEVLFVISEKSDQGIKKLDSCHFKYIVVKDNDEFLDRVMEIKPDIIVNDILNTDSEYMIKLKMSGSRIVNFEDLGEGRSIADAVINALYERSDTLGNTYWGEDYYMMRDEFKLSKPKEFSDELSEITVSFGGTDPCNLTKKTVMALSNILMKNDFHVTIILGLGYTYRDEIETICSKYQNYFTVVQDVKLMTEYLCNSDLAISSQGRTSLELASLGIPTILMSQNERELTHVFGTMKNGFLNLGLGKDITVETIQKTVEWLIETPQLRKNMREEMLSKDLRHGLKRVKSIILGE